MNLYISLAFSLISAAVLTILSLKQLQIMQLCSYQADSFLRWLKRTKLDYLIRYVCLSVLSFTMVLMCTLTLDYKIIRYLGFVFYPMFCILFHVLNSKTKQKVQLKFTSRIIRQLVILPILFCAVSFALTYFLMDSVIRYSLVALAPLTIIPCVLIAHFIMLWVEKLIALKYKKAAKKELLAHSELIKIGITGSYGKTTSKNILNALLSGKYRVLSSPLSYNTPMGLCKLINNGIGDNQILIAEMGARHIGDITELCELINPQYGIITVTGNQHLETFKTLDNVVSEKSKLLQACSLAVINADDSNLMRTAYESNKDKVMLSGRRETIDALLPAKPYASYSNVRLNESGTQFTLDIVDESNIKHSTQISVPLLGKHIPELFAQCALMAFKLGLATDEIRLNALNIKQIEHRLQLIKTANGIVIDDSFNSNPVGARNALDVLSMFNGDRVVITPGLIELGEKQAEENKSLGAYALDKADHIIVVNNPDVLSGANCDMGANVISVGSREDAVAALTGLKLNRPIVLFLNDLPDNY